MGEINTEEIEDMARKVVARLGAIALDAISNVEEYWDVLNQVVASFSVVFWDMYRELFDRLVDSTVEVEDNADC